MYVWFGGRHINSRKVRKCLPQFLVSFGSYHLVGPQRQVQTRNVQVMADQPEFHISQCEILNPPVALMVGYDHIACSSCFHMEDICCSLFLLESGLFWSTYYCCILNIILPCLKTLNLLVGIWGGKREKHLKTIVLCLL